MQGLYDPVMESIVGGKATPADEHAVAKQMLAGVKVQTPTPHTHTPAHALSTFFAPPSPNQDAVHFA